MLLHIGVDGRGAEAPVHSWSRLHCTLFGADIRAAICASCDFKFNEGIAILFYVAFEDHLARRAFLLSRFRLEYRFVHDWSNINQLRNIKLAFTDDLRPTD